ncbi:MAG: DegT/DnrJ/EryC1/StrS aminotransferase family protein [Actinomycetota bacterium]
MSARIRLADLTAHRARIGDQVDARMAEVLDHGRWIMGPEVAEFEAAAGRYVADDSITAIACGNGTDALVLAFSALGLRTGQAVICPTFTFVATAEAVATLGGVPVFAEVGDEEFTLSADGVRLAHKQATEAGLEVVGICSVDLFGAPAPMDDLGPLAKDLGCWLVSDAAQSLGASSGGVKVGALADVTTTSFFPAKPLGCYGDGGMVFVRDPAVADIVRSLRVHGKGSHKYDNVLIGQNSRLDTLQAAVLLAKLDIFDDELAGRRRVADRYNDGLADAAGVVERPMIRPGDVSAWAQYTVVHRDRAGLQAALDAADIDSAIYYPRPLHRQPAYERFHLMGSDLSRSDRLSEHVLSLPMHPYLTDAEIDRVIETVRSVP